MGREHAGVAELAADHLHGEAFGDADQPGEFGVIGNGDRFRLEDGPLDGDIGILAHGSLRLAQGRGSSNEGGEGEQCVGGGAQHRSPRGSGGDRQTRVLPWRSAPSRR